MGLNYKYLTLDDERFLTVYVPGEAPLLASAETHGNFDELVRLAQAGDESVVDLFDTARAIEKAFADVVEGRVAVRGGVVYFDDDAVHNAITEAILRFHEAGESLGPIVKFYENVMANPQEESREQFYRYVEAYNLPIDDEGHVILYKGVKDLGDGSYGSTRRGHAFVNGVEFNNAIIPNRVGDVVTMPRSEVDFDPNAACSSGLHSGTHGYARGYGNTLMYIRVNPRDVVSVPHDVSSQKVRVCRYEVLGFADRDKAYDAVRWVSQTTEGPVEDEVVEDAPATALTVREVPLTKDNVRIGAKVKIVNDRTTEAKSVGLGNVGTVEYVNGSEGWVHLAEAEAHYKYGVWLEDLVLLTAAPEKQAGKRDTRENHKHQKRDAKGHFIKQS